MKRGKVRRGGYWCSVGEMSNPFVRDYMFSVERVDYLGFRIVLGVKS